MAMTKDERVLLQSVSARLDQVHEALYGNGDPSKSMMASQVRQEAAVLVAAEATRTAAHRAAELAEKMDAVVVSVNAHHAKMHLYDVLKSPKAWGLIVVAMLAVRVLLETGGPLVSAFIKATTGMDIPIGP